MAEQERARREGLEHVVFNLAVMKWSRRVRSMFVLVQSAPLVVGCLGLVHAMLSLDRSAHVEQERVGDGCAMCRVHGAIRQQ